ncbi:MAG: hypothetical protein WBZ14_14330 [Terriglobales bacterium]
MNFRAGTYSGVTLKPVNSGSGSSNRITYIAYSGDAPSVPIISAGNPGFWIGNGNTITYFRMSGFTFNNTTTLIGRVDSGSSYNEIDNNNFNNTDGGAGLPYQINISGAATQQWTTNNWVHGNTFTMSGQADGTGGKGCTDGGGDMLLLGVDYGTYAGNTVNNDNNNTIENNVFNYSPHDDIDNYGLYNVIRSNMFHNEPWSSGCADNPTTGSYNSYTYSGSNPNFGSYNGSYGHRNLQLSEDYNRTATYVLFEGNRSGFAGVNQANDGADDLSLAAPQNIIRYNFFYAGMNPGILLKYQFSSGLNSGGHGGTYNRIYNNTFYQNGYGYPWAWPTADGGSCALSYCPWPGSAISIYEGCGGSAGPGGCGSGQGNVLINNIFYLSAGYTNYGWDVIDKGTPTNGWEEINVAMHNWCSGPQTGGDTDSHGNLGCSASGNPLFNNPSLSNPSSTTLPDLSLQSGSGVINGGTYLTTATNSGSSSTTLTVADALYFQDGTWGSALAKATAGLCGTMQADWIAIGTVTNVVQISAVSYGTYSSPAGTITLASPMTWSNGASIWLYRKSDGALVLAGAAPDYGASEYGGSVPPLCLQVTAVN